MDCHFSYIYTPPNGKELLAKMNCCPMEAEPEPIELPTTEAITGFYYEVLKSLRGDTAGHPAYGSFSYHKAAEYYALFGDSFYNYPTWYTNVSTRPPPGFEQLPPGNSTRSTLPQTKPKRELGSNYEASQLYLKMLRKNVPNSVTLQEDRMVEECAKNMQMPVNELLKGNGTCIGQAYAQLLLSNVRHQAMMHDQLQKEQHRQLEQSSSTAVSLAILYEGMLLQQRALIQQKTMKLQQQAEHQLALHHAQLKPRPPPRAIYGRNRPTTAECNN